VKNHIIVGTLATILLSGCATTYQELSATTLTGGYGAKQIEGDVYRVTFAANGYTTRETAQTYWLYRCATVALEKNFEGFEILSNINLVMLLTPEEFLSPAPYFRKASTVYVPVYNNDSNKPFIQGDIRLLKQPFTETPPKVFDAAKLKTALQPYVAGQKCSMGNVCEHVHKYLFLEGKFQ